MDLLGSEAPICPDAADANDDGTIDISDAISILETVFRGVATDRSSLAEARNRSEPRLTGDVPELTICNREGRSSCVDGFSPRAWC